MPDQISNPAGAGWFDRPMRWAQLTLVENDPGRYDPQFWLDYFRRTHADAACLSAAGCVAYYPTEIPLHYRSRWLGDSDPFGELVRGCRAQGMVVIARSDPHAAHQDVYDAHPDWIAVDATGQPRRHWAQPELWVTCALGPYNFEFMTDVHREIMQRYQVDGIFSNRWAGSGMCYCEHCQANFAAASGHALPRTRDPRDATYRAYLGWRQERLFELCHIWDAAVRAINPHARFIPNSGGGALSDLDMQAIGEYSDILFADRQARRGLATPWLNGKNAKEYRATMGSKPIGGIFSIGVEEPYRWKDSVQSDAEIRMWVAEGTANGMRPWYTKFAGVLHDPRWLNVVEDVYTWHAQHEHYLRNQAPIARVAIVYSQQTAWFYGGERARQTVEDPILGVYQALIEARIPFEMVHDRRLDAASLAPFKTLILPNIAALSDAQCDQLRAFVQRGGSLVATFETSRYDEWGQQRPTFGLADLFGVDVDGEVAGPLRNAYLRLEHDSLPGHPLLAGLEQAPRTIYGTLRLPVRPRADAGLAPAPLTSIPSYPDLPMEEVYPRVERTDVPEIYLRQLGDGRVAYIPWDLDRVFWEVLAPDHALLLRNVVLWATDEPPVVEVIGPGVLDVTVWRQTQSLTVHLVNLSNPMLMKGPIRELLPLGAQQVRLRLPAGQRASRVRLLRAGIAPVMLQSAPGVLALTVPSILDHEVIGIDL
jgi:hypothetical protein